MNFEPGDGQETLNISEDFINRKFREYLLTDIIGVGGMGTVYKGYHVRLKTSRAIKVLKMEYSQDPVFKARFEREARILARLDNPHLIRIFEFFEENNRLFLVMEFVSGESLADRLEYSDVIPIQMAVDLIAQACDGLAYAHQQGVVHRDLSPDNLMITRQPDGSDLVKIIDFGIAKSLFEEINAQTMILSDLTSPGIFIGKVRYCSPEQAKGKAIDHRSDQYSLALILYEAITGVCAFQGETPMETLTLRLHDPPPKLSEIRPGSSYPTQLEEVLFKAMEADPENRFPDIIEFKNALIAALKKDEEPLVPAPPVKTTVVRDLDEVVQEDSPEKKAEPENDSKVFSNISEDFKMTRYQPKWVTPLETPRHPAPRRKSVPQNKYQTRKKGKKRWIVLVFLIVLLGAGHAYMRYRRIPYSRLKSEANKALALAKRQLGGWVSFGNASRTPNPPSQTSHKQVVPHKKKRKTTRKHAPNEPYFAFEKGVTPPKIIRKTKVVTPDFGVDDVTFPVTVTVEAVVLKDGKLGSVDVMFPVHEVLDRQAIDTVKKWKFEPGKYRGKPVDVIMDIPLVFTKP